MFTVYYTNMGYGPEQKFQSLDEALTCGKKACFEFSVSDKDGVIAAWSPIGGTRIIRPVVTTGSTYWMALDANGYPIAQGSEATCRGALHG